MISKMRMHYRMFGSLAKEMAHSAGPEAELHHAASANGWKLFTLFGAIPGILVVMYTAITKEKKHIAHGIHDRPEPIEYAHLNKRAKKFPWGDGNHSLFHNKRHNIVPGVGYEEDL